MEAGGPRPGCLTRCWDGSLGLCAHSRPSCTSQTFLGGDTAPPGCAAPPEGTSQPGDGCWSTALLLGALTPSPRSLCASLLQHHCTEGEPRPRDLWHLSSPSLTPSPVPHGGDTPNSPPLQALFCPSAAPWSCVQAASGTSPPLTDTIPSSSGWGHPKLSLLPMSWLNPAASLQSLAEAPEVGRAGTGMERAQGCMEGSQGTANYSALMRPFHGHKYSTEAEGGTGHLASFWVRGERHRLDRNSGPSLG